MIEVTRLDCGIRLVTEAMDGVHSACVGFWVGTGSRDEAPGEAGMSHFLEHLLFKGTQSRTARSIAEDCDAIGADMNAFTTKEYTAFYIRTLADDLGLGLDMLGDIMTEPAFRPEEVDAERHVIMEEVLMHRDEPADVVHERFAAAMFPGHPLGREVLGDPEVIAGAAVSDIASFFGHHYRPANIVVAAAGRIVHDEIAEFLDARYRGRQPGTPPERQAPGREVDSLDVTTRETEQAHLVLGMRAPHRASPDRYALALVNHALGGGLSSRLFQKVREERGLCYSIGSDRVAYADAGAEYIGVGTSPERVDEVLELVRLELEDLAENGLSDREIDLAKSHVRADTLLSLEDSGARMSRIGASLLLHDEVLEAEEVTARIEAVTPAEAAAAAARVLAGTKVLAAVGPFSSDDLRKWTEG